LQSKIRETVRHYFVCSICQKFSRDIVSLVFLITRSVYQQLQHHSTLNQICGRTVFRLTFCRRWWASSCIWRRLQLH